MHFTYGQLEQLFDEHRHILARRLTRIVHCKEIASELVQEAFLRLSGLIGTHRVRYPRALLIRTATNLAIDHVRKKKTDGSLNDPLPLDEGLDVPCNAPPIDRQISAKQQLESVLQIIDGLPPRTREAFLLHRVHGCSYKEIAAHLGISQSAVDKLMTRALALCWSELEEKRDE